MLPEFFPNDEFANHILWGLGFLLAFVVTLWWTIFIIGTFEQVFIYFRKKKSEGTD